MGDLERNRQDEAAAAARLAADQERLLPGEEPDTEHLEDARHWVGVYTELLSVKSDLISVARAARREADPAIQQELSGTDLPILEHERVRFQHRLAFWTSRLAELEGAAS